MHTKIQSFSVVAQKKQFPHCNSKIVKFIREKICDDDFRSVILLLRLSARRRDINFKSLRHFGQLFDDKNYADLMLQK